MLYSTIAFACIRGFRRARERARSSAESNELPRGRPGADRHVSPDSNYTDLMHQVVIQIYMSHPSRCCIGTKTVRDFPAGKTSTTSPAFTTNVSQITPPSASCSCVLAVAVLAPDVGLSDEVAVGTSCTCTAGRNRRPGRTGTRTSSCVRGLSA